MASHTLGTMLLTINFPRNTPSTEPRNQDIIALSTPAKRTVDPYTFLFINKYLAALFRRLPATFTLVSSANNAANSFKFEGASLVGVSISRAGATVRVCVRSRDQSRPGTRVTFKMPNSAAPPSHLATVEIPMPVTAVAFSSGGLLAIGSGPSLIVFELVSSY
jgi:hypothetical protein